MDADRGLPTGTVTFLFTDVEGSTRLWQDDPATMAIALELHDDAIRAAVARHEGHVFATAGDSFAVAFNRANEAVSAAVEIQRLLAGVSWPDSVQLPVRIGLHTGEAHERGGDYFGSAVNRAARVMSLAHGHQVVASASTSGVIADAGIGDFSFVGLGLHHLKGLNKPEALSQVTGPGLRADFDPIISVVSCGETYRSRSTILLAEMTTLIRCVSCC